MLKIYITNLGKYNEGELVGKWVELPCEDLDEVLKEIEVADGTAYEEYAIHDYESDIEGLNIGEYDNIFSLNEIAEKLNELSDYDKKWFEAYLDASGEDLLTALEQFEDHSSFYADMTLEEIFIKWSIRFCRYRFPVNYNRSPIIHCNSIISIETGINISCLKSTLNAQSNMKTIIWQES